MNPRTAHTAPLSTRHPRTFGVAVAGAMVIALSACGGQDAAPQDETAATTTPAVVATTTPGATTTPDATTTAPAPEAAGSERNDAALAAIATAQQATGGTAYEIDDEDSDGTWEVDVMVGDRSIEVEVSGDGAQALSQDDDDDMDDDDRGRLARANTTLEQAIEAALAEVPGTLDDVQLDDRDGIDVWEVTIDTAADDDVEVYVATDDARIVNIDR